MHKHDSWEGPVRGSRAWWRGLGEAGAASGPPTTDDEEKKTSIRWDLVRRIKEEIAQGAYDTPERWDAALERLWERLNE
jgi:hypothetical protein